MMEETGDTLPAAGLAHDAGNSVFINVEASIPSTSLTGGVRRPLVQVDGEIAHFQEMIHVGSPPIRF